jgi:tripartite-type tricarboxylate transporter receptor subunit TctC
MTCWTRRETLVALSMLALLAAASARAQNWPSKPIRLVAPYAPGGGPDILARLIGTELDKSLGTTIVENRAGMGGSVGADYVAKSAPDGYTLLVTTTATQSINPALYPNIAYDAVRDFTPIGRIAYTPTVLVVANDVPAKSLAELIEYARRNPGKLSYATAGPGTMQHITAEQMRTQAGIDILHVPYKGTSQIVPDLVSGRVSMMFNSPAAVMQFVDQGKLRALAITSAERAPSRPGLPTMAESGLPGFEATAWYALYGPAGLPREIVQRLNAELRRVLQQPEIVAKLEAMGMQVAPSSPEELAAVASRDLQKWSALIKARGITAQ